MDDIHYVKELIKEVIPKDKIMAVAKLIVENNDRLNKLGFEDNPRSEPIIEALLENVKKPINYDDLNRIVNITSDILDIEDWI